MARKRRSVVAALNVRIHPHGSGRYIALFNDAFRLKRPLHYWSDQQLLITAVEPPGEQGTLEGVLGRFTEIDFNAKWFNVQTFDEADDTEVRRIQIPPGLKPNYTSFFFSFFTPKHTFVFQTESQGARLSPKLTRDWLFGLLNDARLRQRYGTVEVDVVSDKETIRQIFAIEHLRTVTVEVKRPNSDDLGDYEEEFERRLTEQNARKLTQKLDAIPGHDLKPGDEFRKLAALAIKNGKVEAEGKNAQGLPVHVSSVKHPHLEQIRYDPDALSEKQAYRKAAQSLIEKTD